MISCTHTTSKVQILFNHKRSHLLRLHKMHFSDAEKMARKIKINFQVHHAAEAIETEAKVLCILTSFWVLAWL